MKVKIRNEKGVLLLPVVMSWERLLVGHVALMEWIKGELEKGNADKPDAVNTAIKSLFRLLFGNDGAERLLAWYDGDHMAALDAVSPFYDKKVNPRLRKMYAKHRREA